MTKIEWVKSSDGTKGETYNPIIGCSKISEGCRNCYAERMACRLALIENAPPYGKVLRKKRDEETQREYFNRYGGWNGKTHMVESALDKPLKRKKSTIYFVDSMGDLFHENTPLKWILRVWNIMAQCQHHRFLILTKRAKMMHDLVPYLLGNVPCNDNLKPANQWPQRPLPNVYLGVTAENQKTANERIPYLLKIPAVKRFISIEPMLESVNLRSVEVSDHGYWRGKTYVDALTGVRTSYLSGQKIEKEFYNEIDQVIVGGESGPDARPMHPEWVRSIRDQCKEAGTPFFFKQWGGHYPIKRNRDYVESGDILIDPQGGTRKLRDFRDMPTWLSSEAACMRPCNKKKAGRSLDGRTHDELIWK